ncbi:restriction endonuclease subunit S [Ruegeria atlantica]|uniref:restriction endonuclease subunit S n=1 Tax=Ruegeria atlantica TaxID=81569 RepID=UPI001580EB43
MTSFRFVKLGDVCETTSGGTPNRKNSHYFDGAIPWVKSGELNDGLVTTTSETVTDEGVKNSSAKVFPKGTLLMAMYGATVGKLGILDIDAATNQAVCGIFPTEKLDKMFLFHLLKARRKELIGESVGGAQPNINQKIIREQQFFLPPLDEQRRIVDILNRAASIERLRAQATAHLRDLIPALFIKMFGDPIDNPMGWDVKPLGEVVKAFQGGKNIQAGSGSSPFRILKVSAVTSGVFNAAEAKPAPDDYVPPNEHKLQMGDLLFSRANTAALVGATAIVDQEASNLLLPDKLWRVVLPEGAPVVSEFLHGFLKMPSTRSALSQLATGTSSSMQNISQKKLKTLPTITPPLDMQKKYADLINRVRQTSVQFENSNDRAEHLSASLMAQTFGTRL